MGFTMFFPHIPSTHDEMPTKITCQMVQIFLGDLRIFSDFAPEAPGCISSQWWSRGINLRRGLDRAGSWEKDVDFHGST